MAFWVTASDGATFVSHASSESAARAEAEKRGLVIDDIAPVSSDTLPEDLKKYTQLSASPSLKFKLFCLNVAAFDDLSSCREVSRCLKKRLPIHTHRRSRRELHLIESEFDVSR